MLFRGVLLKSCLTNLCDTDWQRQWYAVLLLRSLTPFSYSFLLIVFLLYTGRVISSADDEVGHIIFKRSGTAVAKTKEGTEVTVNIKVHSFTHVLSTSSGVDIPIPPIGNGESSDGSSVHYANTPANDAVLPSKVKCNKERHGFGNVEQYSRQQLRTHATYEIHLERMSTTRANLDYAYQVVFLSSEKVLSLHPLFAP